MATAAGSQGCPLYLMARGQFQGPRGPASSAQPRGGRFPPLLRSPRPSGATRDRGSHYRHTHTPARSSGWGGSGGGLCGIALRERSGEEATEISGHRDTGTRQLPCRQLHARPAVPRHSREAAAAPAGGGDHSLATPPLSHPRRPGRGAGLGRGLRKPGQS